MTPDTEARLRERIAQLCDKVRDLEFRLSEAERALTEHCEPWNDLGLCRTEMLCLALLVKKGRATKEQLFNLKIGFAPARGEENENIVEVWICKLRAKLPAGVTIESRRFQGYAMSEDSRRVMRELMSVPERGGAAA